MLKERHRYGSSEVSAATIGSSRRPWSNRSGAVPEVGLIPGNRFLLLPLKKVTALVRPHTPCREPSATSTKPCISSRRAPAVRSGNSNIQTVARSRHRRTRVAKAHLSPVSEHHEPLLLDQSRPRTRSRDTSIFTLSVEQAQLWRNADLVRYRKPAAGSRNSNRVAPNYYPDLRSWSFTDKVVSSNYYAVDLRSSFQAGTGSDRSNYHGDLIRSGGEKLVSRKRNSVAQHFRASSPFLCSFTNENDLPFGPSPLMHPRSGRSS